MFIFMLMQSYSVDKKEKKKDKTLEWATAVVFPSLFKTAGQSDSDRISENMGKNPFDWRSKSHATSHDTSPWFFFSMTFIVILSCCCLAWLGLACVMRFSDTRQNRTKHAKRELWLIIVIVLIRCHSRVRHMLISREGTRHKYMAWCIHARPLRPPPPAVYRLCAGWW